MPFYDAIIIGGGTNGFAAAGRLAMAGRRVLVLEKRAKAGGGADTHEFAPGYRISRIAHLVTMLDPRVMRDMHLQRHGLRFSNAVVPTTALSATGDHLVLRGAYGEHVDGTLSAEDRKAWGALRGRLFRFASLLRPFKQMTPPRLERGAGNELMKLTQFGLKLRMLGKDEMQEFLRLLLINIADVLEDELTDERLKGLIAHDAVLGAHMGPRSPNSLMLLLNRLAGDVDGVQAAIALPDGGMGAVADAMRRSVLSQGGEVREGAEVSSIVVTDDRVAGVTLHNGESIAARQVISAINPRTTLLSLLGPQHLDTGFVRRVKGIRMRGTTAKLNLALRAAPDFKGASLRSRLVVAPSARAVEDAFNHVKYNEFSPSPVMEIIVPSAFETGLAPDGHHVLSALVQYAPSAVKGGWEHAKSRFLAAIMKQLAIYAPRINELVVASELLTPGDLEDEYGFVGGNWHHGELAVEQMLFLRPMPGLSQYDTPIGGLWLAGTGCHPGGGISGAAGWNAAERLLKQDARR
jgi:phytoene dehydrogenase-like protein